MTKKFRILFLASAFGGVLSLAGCLLEKGNEGPQMGPGEPAPPCTESAFCRLQNPADTILLSPDQKETALSLLETVDDTTTVVALTSIDVSGLGADTLRIKLLKDLQVSVHTPTFRILGALAPDTAIRRGWRGYFGFVADSGYGFVDVTYKNHAIETGFAVVGGKYFTLSPLGGSMVAVVYVQDMIWMGECSPAIKPAATQLTCGNPLP